MNLLSVENISKSYGEKQLFKQVGFGIMQGEKVALIARNGSGKSTLLRILCGKDVADEGKVTYRNGIKISFLDQEPVFNEHLSIIEAVLASENEISKAVKQYEKVIEEHNHRPDKEMSKELAEAIGNMDKNDAWDYESKVKQILGRLGLTRLNQSVNTLSGGQKKRMALARVLIENPDLLIMDEPTNHLDVDMIEWLEEYLQNKDLSLLLVTHDRYFLDNICSRIIELDNQTIYTYQGNYSYFLEKKSEREFNSAREVDKARNLMRKELEWIRRMPKARGTKSKSRVDAFYEIKDKASEKKQEKEIELHVKMSRIGGKVLEMKKVYKSYDNIHLLKGFDYTFKTGERIGIVGKNGVGKSTFLNLIIGKEQADSGKINVGETIVFGYYSQSGLELKEDKRVIEVVKDNIADVIALGDGTKVSASQFLTMFQFPPEMQYTFVSKLSGGEKRRLYLLTILVKNPNFLILDEPTNDLDLLTLQTLEEFLLYFKGCLLIVSHDRYFMDKLVDHLLVFEGDGVVSDFTGNYREWRLKTQLQENLEKQKNQKIKSEKKSTTEENKIYDEPVKTRKKTFKEKYEFEQIEKELADLEKEREDLSEKLIQNNGKVEELTLWSKRLAEITESINNKELRWLELSELDN
ncbi:MAG: ABC-F family ATP-binding cassette domain-containing protein [Bacteroidia bacterium]|nr:ABC-F family ATP-binding cassette domain-containing protein [Bacteroidia bacterium]MCZ2249954.1 ABC-F family ATP-binding cassette domain-containing protein [Bacteroidia bacterium]